MLGRTGLLGIGILTPSTLNSQTHLLGPQAPNLICRKRPFMERPIMPNVETKMLRTIVGHLCRAASRQSGVIRFCRTENWPEFWAQRRLLPHVPHLPKEIGRRLERLCANLENRLPASPRPALLHGDLWSGNVLFDGSSGQFSGFIDPACYYGLTEVDFGMLELFSRPSREFYDAYGPLEEGHQKRQPIYQLWPAIVHLRLFGSGYRSMVEGLLDKAGV